MSGGSPVDWNDEWNARLDSNRSSRAWGDCASMWVTKEQALAYLRMSREDEGRTREELNSLPLTPGSRVLDIGAGPGTLALPLSRMVAHVTAVEPAEGMIGVLRERLSQESVTNVACIQKRWEDVSVKRELPQPYDVVIASYSLGMKDIRTALSAMNLASCAWVYVYWFAGMNSWEQLMADVWPRLHGRKYQPGPKANVIFNVLYDMGYCPCIDVERVERTREYGSLDEAVADFSQRFRIDTSEQRCELAAYLQDTLEREHARYVYHGFHNRVKLWWHVHDSKVID